MPSSRLPPILAVLVAAVMVSEVHADLAILRNGRVLPVTRVRNEGGRTVLVMAGGGEITVPSEQILAIRPDLQPKEIPSAATAPATGPAGQAIPDPAAPAPAATVAPAMPAPGPIALRPGEVFDAAALRDLAARIAQKHEVDTILVQAVIEVESRYDAFAVSPRGAMGLMQLMPRTAARFDVNDPFDPVQNIDCGVRYLKELLSRYDDKVPLALAAYNAGEDAVDRHRGIPPYRETRRYVDQILRLLEP